MLLLIDSEKLPENYGWRDFVKFHGRDVQQISKRTSADSIEKALSINGQPIRLKIQLDEAHQNYSVMVSGNLSDTEQSELIASAQNMLGVNQEIEAFEQAFIQHPEIGHTLQTQRGLRVPQSSSFYEALTWAIIGQQINLNAAIALRRKLIQLVGLRQAKGLLCYPASTAYCIHALRTALIHWYEQQQSASAHHGQPKNSQPCPASHRMAKH